MVNRIGRSLIYCASKTHGSNYTHHKLKSEITNKTVVFFFVIPLRISSFAAHHYNYYANGWHQDRYPTPRFCSEYGKHSLPCVETLKALSNDTSDLVYNSKFMLHRQHLPGGTEILSSMVKHQFKFPPTDSTHFWEDFVLLTQVSGYY